MENVMKLKYTQLGLYKNWESYNFCASSEYQTVEKILKMPREILVKNNLSELFNKIHSLNLKFDYEIEYATLLAKNVENKSFEKKEFEFLFDFAKMSLGTSYFNAYSTDFSSMQEKIKILICLNKFSEHDLELIKIIFKIDTHKLIDEFNSKKEADPKLNLSICDFDISSRAKNCLLRSDVNTLGDLLLFEKEFLRSFRNLGNITFEEIIKKVHDLGYKFIDEMDEKSISSRSNLDEEIKNLTQTNNDIKVRLEKKEELLDTLKILILEKESLVKKEQELDSEINKVLSKLNKLNGGNYYAKVRK